MSSHADVLHKFLWRLCQAPVVFDEGTNREYHSDLRKHSNELTLLSVVGMSMRAPINPRSGWQTSGKRLTAVSRPL
jgi:hypothetical protein